MNDSEYRSLKAVVYQNPGFLTTTVYETDSDSGSLTITVYETTQTQDPASRLAQNVIEPINIDAESVCVLSY